MGGMIQNAVLWTWIGCGNREHKVAVPTCAR